MQYAIFESAKGSLVLIIWAQVLYSRVCAQTLLCVFLFIFFKIIIQKEIL